MKVQEETIALFDQDKLYVIEYLQSRKITNKELFDIINKLPFGLLEETSFFVGNEEYGISHFLSKSDVVGYDIRKVNTLLGTESIGIVAFAIVIGDDALCYDIRSEEVFLWMIQTDSGNRLHVSDNLTMFLSSLN